NGPGTGSVVGPDDGREDLRRPGLEGGPCVFPRRLRGRVRIEPRGHLQRGVRRVGAPDWVYKRTVGELDVRVVLLDESLRTPDIVERRLRPVEQPCDRVGGHAEVADLSGEIRGGRIRDPEVECE